MGVEVGEYDAKARVSGRSSIWGALRQMPATRYDMTERPQRHEAISRWPLVTCKVLGLPKPMIFQLFPALAADRNFEAYTKAERQCGESENRVVVLAGEIFHD